MQQDTATISRPASPSTDTTTTTNNNNTTDPLLPLYLDAIAKAQAHVLRTGIVDLPSPSSSMPRVVGRVVPSGGGGGGNDVAVYMPAPFARDRNAVLVLQQPAPGSGSGACVWGCGWSVLWVLDDMHAPSCGLFGTDSLSSVSHNKYSYMHAHNARRPPSRGPRPPQP